MEDVPDGTHSYCCCSMPAVDRMPRGTGVLRYKQSGHRFRVRIRTENPFGLAVDGRGWLWVAEAGTGAANGRISIVTPDGQVHPFLTPLPSAIVEGNPIGPTRILFDVNGKMLINQGDGSDPISESVLTVDTSGFVPGSTPLTPAAIESVYAIEPFVVGQGYSDSNPYSIALGPDNDLFVVDAGANLIVRRARATGALSVFSTFPNIGTRQSVPTSIRYAGDRFYVGNLTGFPFTPGTASVFEVSTTGTVSTLQTGFTMIVDIDIDPQGRKARCSTVRPLRRRRIPTKLGGDIQADPGGGVDTIATGLNLPTGMRFRADGQLFVTTRTNGQILRVSFPPTSRIRLNPTTAAYGNLLVSTADTAVVRIQNISSRFSASQHDFRVRRRLLASRTSRHCPCLCLRGHRWTSEPSSSRPPPECGPDHLGHERRSPLSCC